MSHLDTQTIDRLHEAFSITIAPSTVARHEAAISAALRSAPSSAQPRRRLRWRLRIPALVAAAMVVVPIGTAVAAEEALPGDFLYPVKRFTEPIVSFFDSDVVATHRVDELSRIVDSPNETDRIPEAVTDALTDARDAVTDLAPDHHLREDLIAITDRIEDYRVPQTREEPEPTDTAPPHDVRDDPVTDQAPTRTTVPEHPEPTHPPRDVPDSESPDAKDAPRDGTDSIDSRE